MSQPSPSQVPPQRLPRNGAGVSALVIGVLALVLAVLFIFAPLAVILGLVAVALGIIGLVRANQGAATNRGQAAAGLITGVIGLVIGIAIMVSVGTFLARNSLDFRDFGRCMDRAVGADAREACVREFSNRLSE